MDSSRELWFAEVVAPMTSRIAQATGWLPFLDTYRTMCRAPRPRFSAAFGGCPGGYASPRRQRGSPPLPRRRA
jgi:hypothetical protein